MKKTALLFLTVILCLSLFGCGQHIEDTNGDDDYSLVTIDDAKLLSGSSSLVQASVSSTFNGNTKVTVKKFSGVRTEETFRKDGITLTLSANVTSGNLRVVLCTKDEILHEFTLNQAEQSFSFNAKEKPVYLKVAGESAKFEMTYRY